MYIVTMLSHGVLALCSLLCVFAGNAAANPQQMNIDIQEPIARQSPAIADNDDDLFGYSVVLHQVAVPAPGDFQSALAYTRIIVGAPNGTFPGGLPNLLTPNSTLLNNTGLIYQCLLNSTTCLAVGREGVNPTNRRLFDDQPDGTALENPLASNMAGYSPREVKSGQLLGQVLKSSGDFFMACAPLWTPISESPINEFDNRKNIGRCFLSARNLQEFTEVRPCLGDETQGSYVVNSDNRCQAGFGAAFLNIPTSNQTGVLLGAPGTFSGRGQLYLYPYAGDTRAFMVGNTSSFTASERPEIRRPDGTSFDIRSGYDGWSLASGNISGDNESVSVLSGMPRFDIERIIGRVNVRMSNNLTTIEDVSLTGEQIGDYFGHIVETADLNADGYDEVIVGAPFYSEQEMADVGRVYVFENNEGELNETAIILAGSGEGSRFGHSIVNLGDINGDDIPDIAIGAPYYSTGDSNTQGAVFIYFGNRETVISREADQCIDSRTVFPFLGSFNITSLKSFGFSLASAVDVDANGYADLAVGAYDSQSTVLFRTRSVATINYTLTTDSDTVLVVSANTLDVTFCATYSGRGLEGRPLNLTYRLIEVPLSQGMMQVVRTNPTSYSGVLQFPDTGVELCDTIVVGVRSIVELPSGFNSVRDPIQLEISFDPIPRTRSENGELVDFRDFPLIRENGSRILTITPEVGCSNNITGMEVCSPDLSLTVLEVLYTDNAGTRFNQIIAGGVTRVTFVLRVGNTASDPAINSYLTFTTPTGLPFTIGNTISITSITSGETTTLPCVMDSSMLRTCNLPTSIKGMTSMNITLVWELDRMQVIGTEQDEIVRFYVGIPSTPDNETIVSNNNYTQTLEVSAQTNLVITSVTQEPFEYNDDPPRAIIRTPSDLGRPVDIQVTIRNDGPSTIPRVDFEIDIPVRAPNDQYYIYITDPPISTNPDFPIICSQEGINPNNINFTARRSRKRSTTPLIKRQATDPNAEVTEMCSFSDDSSCQSFQCSITDLPGSQQVGIVFVGVFDQRFYATQDTRFTLVSTARVSLGNFSMFENFTGDNQVTITYVVVPMPPGPPNIYLEIWLPIIGGVLALILIVLLFACCIYCGFFRKKRLEEAKKQAGGEFEVRQVPPEDPAMMIKEEKKGGPNQEGTPTKEVGDGSVDIGDAADLEGNGIVGEGHDGGPEKDPEETSL